MMPSKKKTNRRGRKPILTEEIIQNVVSVLRTGTYIETAIACVGISKDTFYAWLRRGARERRRLDNDKKAKPNKEEAIYLQLSDAVKKAIAEAEIRNLAMISQAGETQWQASAWILERRFPERWGKKDIITQTGDNKITIRIVEGKPTESGDNVGEGSKDDSEDLELS